MSEAPGGEVWRSFHNTGATKPRLRNITDATTIAVGGSAYGKGGGSDPDQGGTIYLSAHFTLAASKVISVQRYGEAEADGFGLKVSSGEAEVFGQVKLHRVR